MNEVERLFREQQAASDAKRDPETDIPSAQTMLNQDEGMNEAESLFQEQQAAFDAGRNAKKNIRSVETMLNIGIILKTIQTAVEISMFRFPKPALALAHISLDSAETTAFLQNPIFLIQPLLSFGIILLIYYLLKKQNRQTTDACVPLLILTLILPIFLSAVSIPLNLLFTHWISRIKTIKLMSAYSAVRSSASILTLFSGAVIPLFAAAAGIICYARKKQQQ